MHDDDEEEDTEHFFLDLSDPIAEAHSPNHSQHQGSHIFITERTCRVSILDSSSPGVFGMAVRSLEVKGATARVPVARLHGCAGASRALRGSCTGSIAVGAVQLLTETCQRKAALCLRSSAAA